jgi:hypothetical protein
MKFLKIFFGLFTTMLFSFAVSSVYAIHPAYVAGALGAAGLLYQAPKNVLAAGVLQELWTGELIDHFRHMGKWLARIPSQDNYVNNDVIHLVDVGADPAVLIDNTSYPIATASRTDTDIAVALKKFDTENTRITDDELYGLPYDKEGSVLRQHRETLEETTKAYGLFSLAPAADGANTPVIETSGSTSEVVSGFKDFTPADLRKVKLAMDNLKIPNEGRMLILCPEHANALLDNDASFRDKYANTKTGEIINHFGFEMYEDPDSVKYDVAGDKKAFGAAPVGSDRPGSVFLYNRRAFKAMGSVNMYYSPANEDPQNRESVMGFRLHHIVLPKKNTGFGAIISAPTT